MFKSRRHQKGFFLIGSYLLISVVGTLALALFLKSLTLNRTIEHAQNRIRAFETAESGLDTAIVVLKADSNYAGQGFTVFGAGGYEITVETPDPVTNPTIRRIRVTGHVPTNAVTSYAYERRDLTSYVNLSPTSPFDFGLFGDQEVSMSGRAMTDSYDSRRGPYAPGGTNGDIGTNSTDRAAISLTGSTRVVGDAVAGAGGNPAAVISVSPNATVTGSQTAAPSKKTLSPVEVPRNLIDRGNLTARSGDPLTYPGGTYLFSSVSVGGTGSVSFTGPATVYVRGDVSVSSQGVVTTGDKPPNLLFYVAGSDSDVKISGGGKVYAGIYAPKSEVSLSGNAELFGAVIGKEISFSGAGENPSRIHYDEALKTVSGGSGATNTVQVKSWQEI